MKKKKEGHAYTIIRDCAGDDHVIFGPGDELVFKGGLPTDEQMTQEAIAWLLSHLDEVGSFKWNHHLGILGIQVARCLKDAMAEADSMTPAEQLRDAAVKFRSVADQLEQLAEAAE